MTVLGQVVASLPGDPQFHGELSRVNVYDYAISEAAVGDMGKDTYCANSPQGNVRPWVEFDEHYLVYDVIKKEPSIRGGSDCPPGFRGALCDIQIDKILPTVVFCHSDTTVVDSTSRLVTVTWLEPTFTDNVGVTNITQTHRSGMVRAYGEYYVTYVAYDT